MDGNQVSGLSGYYDELWRNTGVPPYVQALFPAIKHTGLTETSCILDIACGNGVLGKWIMNQYNCAVSGIDISPVALDICKQAGYKRTQLVDLDREPIPYGNNQFDLVTLSAVIEHVLDPEKVIGEIWRILKPGGYLVLLTPNISWIVNRILFLFGFWEHKLMGGTKGHISYMNKKRLGHILHGAKFQKLDWQYSVICTAGNSKICTSGITGFVIQLLHNRRLKYMQSLLAFNFIVVAQKEI